MTKLACRRLALAMGFLALLSLPCSPVHAENGPALVGSSSMGTWGNNKATFEFESKSPDGTFLGKATVSEGPNKGYVISFSGTLAADDSITLKRTDKWDGKVIQQICTAGPPRLEAGLWTWTGVTDDATTGEKSVFELKVPDLAPGKRPPEWAHVSKEQIAEAGPNYPKVALEDPTTGIRFVLIPKGQFEMGAPRSDEQAGTDERPAHTVTVRAFYLAISETTNAQWRKFKPDHVADAASETDNAPVVGVSRDDALAYVAWVAKSGGQFFLPSETEWEYACRAGTKTLFSTGDTLTAEQANFGNNVKRTEQVGGRPANPWGLYDMHGNVWEWCSDDYHPTYEGCPTDQRAWIDTPRSARGVMRGGSWRTNVWGLRSSLRGTEAASTKKNDVGFRVGMYFTPP